MTLSCHLAVRNYVCLSVSSSSCPRSKEGLTLVPARSLWEICKDNSPFCRYNGRYIFLQPRAQPGKMKSLQRAKRLPARAQGADLRDLPSHSSADRTPTGAAESAGPACS